MNKTNKHTLRTVLMLSALCAGFATQAATLVNEWKFEGNASDTSGNHNDGTITGSPSYVPGKFGQGLYVNQADKVQNAAAAGLPTVGSDSWSMNLWLYLTNTPGSLAYLAGFGGGNALQARGLIAYGDPGSRGIYAWGGNSDLASGIAYPLNQWIMVTITHDGATSARNIYLNGTNIASSTLAALGNTVNTIIAGGAGGGPAGWGGRYQGILDEFTIWRGALTTDEVAGLYASNSLPLLPPTIATVPQPVTAYAGEYASLTVAADGTAPFAYQWWKGTAAITGATNMVLVFNPLGTSDAGDYTVVVSNSEGSVTSMPPATVTVLPVPSIATALAGYWPFNDVTGITAADVTGLGNDGTLVNFPYDDSQWVPGKIGGALNFRGQGTSLNDYVQVNNQNINPLTTMTISAWVWADAISTWASIVKNWPGGSSDQVHFGMNALDGDLSNYLGGPDGGTIGPVREGLGTLMPLGTWVHVALVCNGQTMQLYRNGAAIGTPVAYGGLINTNTLSNTLGFGAKINANGVPPTTADGGYWKGKMDDIGIWTRGLTKAEILSIYLAGQAGQPLTNAGAYSVTLPYISGQPQGVAKYAGEYQANFTVLAVGEGTLSYEWNENGTALIGATNNTLSLHGPLTNSTSYRVVVTDAGNGLSVTSAPAALTINAVTSISTALAGYWPLNETTGMTAADSTANARTATLNGYYDNSMWVPGQIGGALAFGGSSYAQYATVTNFVQAANGTLSISAWVWADAEDDRASIVDNYGDNAIGQFRFGLGSDVTRPLTGGVISQAAGYVAATEGTGCPTSSWQHVALVADGATLRLYRNGVLAVTNAYNGTIVSPSAISNLFIGARIADDGISLNAVPGYWTGKMDDLGMWTRGLTADEVLGIYAAGYNHQPLTAASSTGVKPIIGVPPASLTVTEGDDARFTVSATGAAPLGYQWWKGGVPISGATNASLLLHSAVLSDAADYTVVVANFVGSVTSAPAATLTVTALSRPLPPIINGLVAYWKFDETAGTNALDSAGVNNAALNNYPADNSQWMPGMVGGALAFDGSSEFGYVADYPKPETNMTVAAWVWADSRPGWASILKNWGDASGGQFHFGLYSSDGDLSIFVQQADGSFPNTREGIPFPLGSWQHVAFTCDGTLVRLYRNGIQVASVPYDGTLQPNPVMTCLGIGVKTDDTCAGASTQASGYWEGKMDDMGLWTRGLSSVEIQEIYSSGLEGRNLEQASLSPTLHLVGNSGNLVFTWPEAPLGRGFVLESTASLSSASWAPAGGTLTVANGQCSVSVPAASAGQNFFRLRQ
jgi:hypothetical protein